VSLCVPSGLVTKRRRRAVGVGYGANDPHPGLLCFRLNGGLSRPGRSGGFGPELRPSPSCRVTVRTPIGRICEKLRFHSALLSTTRRLVQLDASTAEKSSARPTWVKRAHGSDERSGLASAIAEARTGLKQDVYARPFTPNPPFALRASAVQSPLRNSASRSLRHHALPRAPFPHPIKPVHLAPDPRPLRTSGPSVHSTPLPSVYARPFTPQTPPSDLRALHASAVQSRACAVTDTRCPSLRTRSVGRRRRRRV
jgi:hypothetical protein